MKLKGWIESTAGGRWRLRHRPAPGLKPVTLGTFDTEEEAQTFQVAASTAIEQRSDEDLTEGVTLGEIAQKVLTLRERGKEISRPKNDWSRYKNHVAPYAIAKIPVRLIGGGNGPTVVKDWLDELKDAGVSPPVRQHAKNLVSVFMGYAVERRQAKSNPCLAIKIKKKKKTADDWTYATPAQQAALLAVTPKPEDAIVEFAIGSGLRGGELVSLRLCDVHMEVAQPYLTVRYGGPPTDDHPQGAPPKWGHLRDVQLFGHSLRAMKRWLEALPAYCKENPHGLVFPGRHGGYRSADHVFRWAVWKGSPQKGQPGERNYHAATVGLVERAGLPQSFRWHDLRHTCASSLVSGWWGRIWSLQEVADLLGHESVETTERYAHLHDTAIKRAARETQAAFDAPPAPVPATPPAGPAAPAAASPEAMVEAFAALRALLHAAPFAQTASADSSIISKERDTGLEPATFGLGSPSERQSSHVVSSVMEQKWSSVLQAAVRGEANPAAAMGLARDVMASPAVALALQVLGGGPAATTAAVQLAALVAPPAAPTAAAATPRGRRKCSG